VRTFARSNFASSKVNASGYVFAPAIAAAKPAHVIVDAIRIDTFNRNQSTEALTRDILECGHRTASTVRSQVAKPVPTLASLRILA
jgi:hypothetical protein